MSRHVYFVPHLLKITFTSPPVYFTSSVLCIPFQVTFNSDHVYFASRLPRPRLRCVTSTLRHVYFASFYLATRLFSITFTFLPVCLASRFFFPPFCFASRSLRAPFACLHVHVLPRLFSVTFISLLVSSPHVLFSPVYLCYVHLTCRFLSFTFTVSPVFFLLRSLRFSFSRFMFTFFPVYFETRSFRLIESSPCSFCTSFTN